MANRVDRHSLDGSALMDQRLKNFGTKISEPRSTKKVDENIQIQIIQIQIIRRSKVTELSQFS
jgi:hypothetical protein